MDHSGPVPTIISVFRRAAACMLDDFIERMDAAGFGGLTRAHQAVFENLDRDGTRLTELAARAGITQQSMSELVLAIERVGYVERRTDPADRRARLVRLTPEGRQMVRRGIREMKAIESEWRELVARNGTKGDVVQAISRTLAELSSR
jgi:DNA-binding MarR family transcriptional regulator